MSAHALKKRISFLFLTLFITSLPSISIADAEKNNKDAGYYLSLGNTYSGSGDNKEAINAYKQALKIKPDLAEAFYNLGVSYGKLDMHKEAVEAYKQAIRIQPDIIAAHYNLGVAYLNVNNRKSALEEYEILKDLGSQQADELLNLIKKHSSKKGRLTIP